MKKIICNILLIIIIILQILSINVFAYDDVEDIGNQIYTDLQILEFDSSLGIDNYNVLNAVKQYKNNPQKMAEWTNAMIDILKIATDESNGQAAQQLAKISDGKEDLEKCYKVAYKALEDIYFVADMDTYIVNSTQKKRAQEFRDLMLSAFNTTSIGSIQSKIESAKLTYKAALSDEINNSSNTNNENNELFHYTTEEQINNYYKTHGYNYPKLTDKQIQDLELKWRGILNKNRDKDHKVTNMKEYVEELLSGQAATIQGATEDEVDAKDAETQEKKIDKDIDAVYQQPTKKEANNESQDVITDANKFLQDGEDKNEFIKEEELKKFSQDLYGILLGLGIIIAVIVGVIIGIRLMFAPVTQKAEAKKLLVPYIAGCIVVFGAFGIWKIVVTIMQSV